MRAFDLLEHLTFLRLRFALLHQDEFMRLPGGGDIGGADLAGECLADRVFDAVEVNELRQRREGAEQRRVRHRPPDMLHREFGRRHDDRMALRQAVDDLADMEFGECLVGVDQEVTVAGEAGEYVDHLEQRRILHDQAIRLQDRLAQPYFLVGDPAERHHRCPGALGSETGECLGVPPFEECGDREHLGPGNHPLPPATVNSHLKHRRFPRGLFRPSWKPSPRAERVP